MCGCLLSTLTGDLACNPGMCHDWESNCQPFGLQASTQYTEPPARARVWISVHLDIILLYSFLKISISEFLENVIRFFFFFLHAHSWWLVSCVFFFILSFDLIVGTSFPLEIWKPTHCFCWEMKNMIHMRDKFSSLPKLHLSAVPKFSIKLW